MSLRYWQIQLIPLNWDCFACDNIWYVDSPILISALLLLCPAAERREWAAFVGIWHAAHFLFSYILIFSFLFFVVADFIEAYGLFWNICS